MCWYHIITRSGGVFLSGRLECVLSALLGAGPRNVSCPCLLLLSFLSSGRAELATVVLKEDRGQEAIRRQRVTRSRSTRRQLYLDLPV